MNSTARVVGSGGARPPGHQLANMAASARQQASHASGAGIAGVPASERVGGSGGAKPPGHK
jgi:hypothetical protein